MSKDNNVLNVSHGDDCEGEECTGEYLEMGEDLSSDNVNVDLSFVEDLKSLNFTDYCGEKNISNYLEEYIHPQLKELGVIKLTNSLNEACKLQNLMRIALIYRSCKYYPHHWTSALKALALEEKKVCIKALAKLKAAA